MTPQPLADLIEALRCLPGIGPKSAQRMAYHLMQYDRPAAARLALSLQDALERVRRCQRCNAFSETEICARCASTKRNPALLCVVETPVDMNRLEETQAYQGFYYVLMGRVSPLDGMGPERMEMDKFLARLRDGSIREVILATNYTNEGEATAHYIATLIASANDLPPLSVSRLARGVPIGGELEFVDSGTLAQALRERRPIED
ncbi:MAG: recombination mediator RecR [Zoogloeaceae bacterium]|jgi:recombination protein RecR|nr:recombination mediator RecR [Zoogloeaceae bacterium]